MGPTDQTYYKPYIEVSKLSNSVIDFDLKNVQKALEQGGKSESAEKVVVKIHHHFLDSSRIVRRSYGNKLDYDFQMFNWGVALTADVGMENDRVDLLMLTYGRTSPNRITLTEFELIILKHTSFKHMDKKERKLKWTDLVASFKIQAGSQRSVDVTKSIGKRQMRSILDVNDIVMAFDLTEFASDLRHNDRYMCRLHSLLVDDPLINGKRLSTQALYGKTREERLGEEKRRMDAFSKRIAAEEDESRGEAVPYSAGQEVDSDAAMRAAFARAAELQENRAATRAIRMAEKAEKRSADKLIQDQRHAAASAAAKLIRISETVVIDASQDEAEGNLQFEDHSVTEQSLQQQHQQQQQQLVPEVIGTDGTTGGDDIIDVDETAASETEVLLPEEQAFPELLPVDSDSDADYASPLLLSPPLVFPMRVSRDNTVLSPDASHTETEETEVAQDREETEDELKLAEMSRRLEEHRRVRADETAAKRQQREVEKLKLKELAEERLRTRASRLAHGTVNPSP